MHSGTVHELLERQCPPAVVRQAWGTPPGRLGRGPWESLAEMGVMQVLVPVAAGGLGLDFCSLVLVLEESGRAALPHPLVGPRRWRRPCSAPASVARWSERVSPAHRSPPPRDVDRLVVDDRGSLLLAGRDEVVVENIASIDGGRRLGRIAGIAGTAEMVASGPATLEAAFDAPHSVQLRS